MCAKVLTRAATWKPVSWDKHICRTGLVVNGGEHLGTKSYLSSVRPLVAKSKSCLPWSYARGLILSLAVHAAHWPHMYLFIRSLQNISSHCGGSWAYNSLISTAVSSWGAAQFMTFAAHSLLMGGFLNMSVRIKPLGTLLSVAFIS